MRKIPALIAFLLFTLLLPLRLDAVAPVAARMTERLRQDLTYRNPDDLISAIVYIRESLDLRSLDRGLSLASAGKEKRHSTVVGAMLQSAQATQAPIITLLEAGRGRWPGDKLETVLDTRIVSLLPARYHSWPASPRARKWSG